MLIPSTQVDDKLSFVPLPRVAEVITKSKKRRMPQPSMLNEWTSLHEARKVKIKAVWLEES
jgi:hypothetical protein